MLNYIKPNVWQYVGLISEQPELKMQNEPSMKTIENRCSQGLEWDEERPLFGDFILEENLYGGWCKDARSKRFVVSTSLILSALVGLLIPVFAGSVVYGAKVITESTTWNN